jgi:uncharacterized oxidoreductase
LKNICTKLFEGAGVSKEDARISSAHLVTSNLMGHDSHGVMRVRPIIESIRRGDTRPDADFVIAKDLPAAMVVDANYGVGLVAAEKTAHLVIEKGKENGIGMATIEQCNFIGRVGHYPEIMADSDVIGFTTACASPNVAPFGGVDPIMGTNPLSISIPTNDIPVLVDMATSVVAGGKVSLAMAKNEEIPLGWIVDSEGRLTTNPNDLRPFYGEKGKGKRGALLPFGAHKGSAINIVIQILGRILARGGPGWRNGVVMSCIDVDQFIPVDEFKDQVSEFVGSLKNSRKYDGVDEILIAGEPEFRTKQKRLREGIFVDDKNWDLLNKTAEELNVKI